ncbi:MAG: sugar phosphate isomerase/epimerase [Clostridia bacterium]|nr:sugar phosphate isomerase/epimerase [Clostridia bacterium]
MAMKVGIQLYSVRDEMAKDPINAIRTVAGLGYKNLEFASSKADTDPGVGFGVDADTMNALLAETGAKLISGHVRPINEDTIDALIEYHKKVGTKYIGQSSDFYDSYEHLLERCEYYNWVGKKLAENGMQFLVHNHYHEFQKLNGKEVLYHIMDNTDPEYVSFELDTFWAMRGGMDPIEVMKRLGSRLKLVHQKDFSKTSTTPINLWTIKDPNVLITRETFGGAAQPTDFCEIGTGIMDIQSIINAANELGAEYIVLEQDWTQLTQMESVKISMEAFKKFEGLSW